MNKDHLPSQTPGQPRTDARKSKLRALTPAQYKSLRTWLVKEKLTYAQARKQLLEQFDVSLSIGAVSVFYHRYCVPIAPAPDVSDVLLDVVIQCSKPVRIIVRRKNGGVKIYQKINGQ